MKFKINDFVKCSSRIGKILDKKEIVLPWNKYVLYHVEFEHKSKEWINEMYLRKVNV